MPTSPGCKLLPPGGRGTAGRVAVPAGSTGRLRLIARSALLGSALRGTSALGPSLLWPALLGATATALAVIGAMLAVAILLLVLGSDGGSGDRQGHQTCAYAADQSVHAHTFKQDQPWHPPKPFPLLSKD